jgi:hypothetical protein
LATEDSEHKTRPPRIPSGKVNRGQMMQNTHLSGERTNTLDFIDKMLDQDAKGNFENMKKGEFQE